MTELSPEAEGVFNAKTDCIDTSGCEVQQGFCALAVAELCVGSCRVEDEIHKIVLNAGGARG